jgi:hypothetical protein
MITKCIHVYMIDMLAHIMPLYLDLVFFYINNRRSD